MTFPAVSSYSLSLESLHHFSLLSCKFFPSPVSSFSSAELGLLSNLSVFTSLCTLLVPYPYREKAALPFVLAHVGVGVTHSDQEDEQPSRYTKEGNRRSLGLCNSVEWNPHTTLDVEVRRNKLYFLCVNITLDLCHSS